MNAHTLSKRSLRYTALAAVTALTISIAPCSGSSTTADSPSAEATSGEPGGASKLTLTKDVTLTGAGATFPAPLYQKWFQDLNQKDPQIKINYTLDG